MKQTLIPGYFGLNEVKEVHPDSLEEKKLSSLSVLPAALTRLHIKPESTLPCACAVLAETNAARLVAGVVHAHTTFSDGSLTPKDLVAHAHSKGLGVVCVTDHHFGDWRYPLGFRIRKPAVMAFGVRPYYEALEAAARSSIGPIVLPGIEVMPHYRWTGVPPFLTCHAMKNLVLYGIDASCIETLPVRLDGKGKGEGGRRARSLRM